MNKTVITLSLLAALACAATTAPAYAISERYRQQLEQSGKTQIDEIKEAEHLYGNPKDAHSHAPRPVGSLSTYEDDLLSVVVDGSCQVKKVNGFAPVRTKHLKKDMDEVQTKMGVTLSVLYMNDRCDITWTDKQGRSGILKQK